MSGVFNATAGFVHTVPVFNPPTQAVPTQAFFSIFHALDFHRCQQVPLYTLQTFRWIILHYMNNLYGNRALILMVIGRGQLNRHISK